MHSFRIRTSSRFHPSGMLLSNLSHELLVLFIEPLPLIQYQLNCESAEWHHHKQRTFHARKWLGYVSFTGGGMVVEEKKVALEGLSIY